jgi:hypothetical protein
VVVPQLDRRGRGLRIVAERRDHGDRGSEDRQERDRDGWLERHVEIVARAREAPIDPRLELSNPLRAFSSHSHRFLRAGGNPGPCQPHPLDKEEDMYEDHVEQQEQTVWDRIGLAAAALLTAAFLFGAMTPLVSSASAEESFAGARDDASSSPRTTTTTAPTRAATAATAPTATAAPPTPTRGQPAAPALPTAGPTAAIAPRTPTPERPAAPARPTAGPTAREEGAGGACTQASPALLALRRT